MCRNITLCLLPYQTGLLRYSPADDGVVRAVVVLQFLLPGGASDCIPHPDIRAGYSLYSGLNVGQIC